MCAVGRQFEIGPVDDPGGPFDDLGGTDPSVDRCRAQKSHPLKCSPRSTIEAARTHVPSGNVTSTSLRIGPSDDATAERVVVGSLAGLAWCHSKVPSGVYR